MHAVRVLCLDETTPKIFETGTVGSVSIELVHGDVWECACCYYGAPVAAVCTAHEKLFQGADLILIGSHNLGAGLKWAECVGQKVADKTYILRYALSPLDYDLCVEFAGRGFMNFLSEPEFAELLPTLLAKIHAIQTQTLEIL